MKKIKYFLASFLVAFCLACFLTGCSSVNELQEEKITVTDMLGDSIEINKNPKKVACVSRTTYDLLVAFGLGDKIDGAYYAIYNNPWTEVIYPKSKDEYHYEYEESYETFISRGVDLVFAPEKYISDSLKEHGINSLCVSLYGNPTFDNYVYFFADLVKQLWDSKEASEKVDAWKAKVAKAITDCKVEDVANKKVFYVRGDKNKGIGYTDSKSSFTEYAYRVLGYEFAGSVLNTTKPSKEDIIKYNPDYFIIGGVYQNTLVDTLKNDELYQSLEAVKNNQIYTIPVGLTMFEQLSCMTPIFFYDMANKLNPQENEWNIKELISNTINEYFKTTLTDIQIDYMIHGLGPTGEKLA